MPGDVHRRGTMVLCAGLALLGVAIIARTVEAGGGPFSLGALLGVLFVLAGAGRFWATWRNG